MGRFVVVETVKIRGYYDLTILVDQKTGVEYLYVQDGGATLIVDEDGNPVVNEAYRSK